ncbi:FAD dependent oxidoreductase [Aspergillus caelatus]|uniref:FAD dependent oxidoreductase n=1 Tax=Aspergillus caelatus TaxID=61420 RepID=A0A5N7A6J1_9EURO|nr:FAD dependent oxidoreductase [Aspergillus caelatus]KAE8365048.1 FAD dependent oxidoreductase [Aspergillus caelatus]
MQQSSFLPDKSCPRTDRIIIVGAGVFGLATALELRKRGYQQVFVLDRHMPPVPDGSSVDISRVIRVDYADPFYAKLGLEALQMWRQKYDDYFNECEFALLTESIDDPRVVRTKQALRLLGQTVHTFRGGDEFKARYPLFDGDLPQHINGYSNKVCGWVNAKHVIQEVVSECTKAGISFITGKRGMVMSLLQEEKKLVGIKLASGETLTCARLILATGSWTNHLLDLHGAVVSTCHPVASIQLSKDEAAKLAKQPVTCNLTSGVFVFPPTSDNILKVARHDYGYETTLAAESRVHIRAWSSTSAPRLFRQSFKPQFIPDEADAALRAGLTLLLPQFKDHPWINRKLCWYSDTPDGDFIIDHHPDIAGLFFATGDSGHGFKFLPIIGQYVVDILEHRAPSIHRARWAYKPTGRPMCSGMNGSRGGPPRRVLTSLEQAKL